jgi:hypothetical protein
MEAKQRQYQADEEEITEKMTKGLTREQALAVIRRQREHDRNKQEHEGELHNALKRALTGRETVEEAMQKARPLFPMHSGYAVIRAAAEKALNEVIQDKKSKQQTTN